MVLDPSPPPLLVTHVNTCVTFVCVFSHVTHTNATSHTREQVMQHTPRFTPWFTPRDTPRFTPRALGAQVRRGCTRFQIPCFLCLKEQYFPPTMGISSSRLPNRKFKNCTNFEYFVIIQMHICRNPRTHVLPTRRVQRHSQIHSQRHHTCEQVSQHISMRHVTHIYIKHTYECVTSHMWTSHVTYINKSCHTYQSVTSHIWTSLVTGVEVW